MSGIVYPYAHARFRRSRSCFRLHPWRFGSAAAAAGPGGTTTPWVLDPVAIGTLPIRTALAAELLALRPSAIRGNASEVMALAGEGSGGRGVDSIAQADDAIAAARALAREYGSVVTVSGPTDLIISAPQTARVEGGSPLLTQVTGGGCALGAVIACFLGVERAAVAAPAAASVPGIEGMSDVDYRLLCVAVAHGVYGQAAERAAAQASGPGSFAVAFLDALAGLSPADAAEHNAHAISVQPC